MKIGLLNYYKGDLMDGVRDAVRAYKAHFDVMPNECHVNAQALEQDTKIGGVRVVRSPRILQNHYWIGRSEQPSIDLPLFRGAA